MPGPEGEECITCYFFVLGELEQEESIHVRYDSDESGMCHVEGVRKPKTWWCNDWQRRPRKKPRKKVINHD
jgi:hypothetical protein